MALVLADAIIRVSLDKTEYNAQMSSLRNNIKKQTSGLSTEISNGLKTQISNLRKEARAIGQIGREFNKVGTTVFKFGVAPAIALGTTGIMKYLKTTDAGAKVLSSSLNSLKYSWNQMLARVGKAIYDHTALGNVIKGLKKYIDSIDEKKIMKIFDTAKVALFTSAILKTVGSIMTMTSAVLKTSAAIKILQFMSQTSGGKGAATSAVATATGGIFSNMLQSAGAGASAGIFLKGMEAVGGKVANLTSKITVQELANFQRKAKGAKFNIPEYRGEMSVQDLINYRKKKGFLFPDDDIKKTLSKMPPPIPAIPAKPIVPMGIYGKTGIVAATAVLILGTWNMLISFFGRLGLVSKDLLEAAKSVSGMINYVFDIIFNIFASIMGAFKDIGTRWGRVAAMVGEKFGIGKGLTKEEKDMSFSEYFFANTMAPWKKDKGGVSSGGAMSFKSTVGASTSFADLNKLQQELSATSPIVDNTDATKENTAAVKENTQKFEGRELKLVGRDFPIQPWWAGTPLAPNF